MAARFGGSRPWLAWKRYTDARGNVLAAGVGYFAFFSIFPALALAFAVFGFVLLGHPGLFDSVFAQLGGYLPGLIKDVSHPDGPIEIPAPTAAALTITGVIAFVALVLGGLGWLGATREGIRAIFGVQGPAGNLITNKVRDLGVLFTLGLGIAVLAVLTSVMEAAAGRIAGWIGLPGQGWVLVLASLVLSIAADTGLMIILLRVVSGLKVPWRELLQGALVGGVGLSVLKLTAATLLPRLTANPLFASFAIVVGLLIWLNLIARLVLVSAAWAANDVCGARGEATPTVPAALGGGPGTVPGVTGGPSSGATRDPALPTFGARSADRTTLAAGFVLGVAGAVSSGALARGIRSVTRLVRG
jgi:membrane protein